MQVSDSHNALVDIYIWLAKFPQSVRLSTRYVDSMEIHALSLMLSVDFTPGF
jgi:hypothetical protein